ncbi:MAG TPA: FkbM family methyltransferase [Acidimicrobiales bacterium]|nr:FkbM family methyltransferase [Acidimicrobiales bacterium]
MCQDAVWGLRYVRTGKWTFVRDAFVGRIPNLLPNLAIQERERHLELRDGTVLFYRTNKADLDIFREVFIYEVYRLPEHLRPAGVLVDLGANIGMASVWCARRYDVERVVAVEPVPANAALLRKNIEVNSIPCQIVQATVGPRRGEVSFSTDQRAGEGHVVEEGMTDFTVEMVTMDDVLKDVARPIALLKMDIEGGEGPLINEGSLSWLNDIEIIAAELHPQYLDVSAMMESICTHGFTLVPAAERARGTEWVFVRQPVGAGSSNASRAG